MDTITNVSIFVASPGDVEAEREALRHTVEELNELGVKGGRVILSLKRWETHAWPGFGADAQDVINGQTGEFDIFVGIMWNRLGTPTRRSRSGTVEEFERAYEKWKVNRRPSLMFYFNTEPANFSDIKELRQKELVLGFKDSLKKYGALFWEYRGSAEFTRLVRKHLFREVERISAVPVIEPLVQVPPVNPAIDRIRNMGRKLGYWHVGTTQQLLDEIERIAIESDSEPVRQAAVAAVLLFLNNALLDDNEQVTARARDLRKLAFNVVRTCSRNDLRQSVSAGELESLDLFAFDFSRLQLQGLSFSTSFLLEADFRSSVLDGASLRNAWIRNAEFLNASLKGADLTGADWFNAMHFTERQLREVKPGSLLPAPASVEAMHDYLRERYHLPYDSWRAEIQRDLLDTWQECLKPGGLREVAARLAGV